MIDTSIQREHIGYTATSLDRQTVRVSLTATIRPVGWIDVRFALPHPFGRIHPTFYIQHAHNINNTNHSSSNSSNSNKHRAHFFRQRSCDKEEANTEIGIAVARATASSTAHFSPIARSSTLP